MAVVLTDNQNYTDIADAIRAKNPDAGQMTPSDMPAAIRAISASSPTNYPIGSIYVTTSNDSPDHFFGGTWKKIDSDHSRTCIGSQVLYDHVSGSGAVNKRALLGAYDYIIIDGICDNITVPPGYHIEYRLFFQGTNNGGMHLSVNLNNISTSSIVTWSDKTFRTNGSSGYFKKSDIIMEPVYGYADSLGTNLTYSITGSGNDAWEIFNISVSAFIVSDDIYNTWKRVESV